MKKRATRKSIEKIETRTLSANTEEALTDLSRYHSVDVLRHNLENPDSNVTESLVTFVGGDYVWIVGCEVFRYFVAPRRNGKDAFRLVRYDDCGGEELGTFVDELDADEARNEYFRLFAARDLLSGFYTTLDDLEWSLKIVPIEKENWEEYDNSF